MRLLNLLFYFQDKVPLTTHCATSKSKPISLAECILCQKKKRSEYLSSGDTGRNVILSLAKQTQSNDIRDARVLQLTVHKQGIMKYHSSSCYRNFLRDMAKTNTNIQPSMQSEQPQEELLHAATSERRSKSVKRFRLLPGVTTLSRDLYRRPILGASNHFL